MKPTLLFIHGMFLTGRSWRPWLRFFEARGHRCLAPSWPLHEDEPAELRLHVPPGTGELALETVVHACAESARKIIRAGGGAPVLIGHSVGGLIVQRLIAEHLGRAGVCLSSVAPNRMLALDWGFFRNSAAITNPLKGDEPFRMTPEGFHRNFCNAVSRAESDRLYGEYAVHESRNMLRDCMGDAGRIDVSLPHAPLLFVSGDADAIIPEKLSEKNARAYTDAASVTDFRDFRGRGHFIQGQPGWEEVAQFVADWIDTRVPAPRFDQPVGGRAFSG